MSRKRGSHEHLAPLSGPRSLQPKRDRRAHQRLESRIRTPPIEELSDEELEAELQRRKLQREAAERAAAAARHHSQPPNGQSGSDRYRKAHTTSGGTQPNRSKTHSAQQQDARLSRLYAQLECPYGADLTSVRKHYRRLIRKYHPDLHTGNPEKQRLATELTQKLTTAYNELRQALTRP